MEEGDWKPFRNALDKKDRKKSDECLTFRGFTFLLALILFDMPDFTPILMAILLYHYKQLTKCISEIEQIEAKLEGQQQKREKEKEYLLY
jgi:hypothetical protein